MSHHEADHHENILHRVVAWWQDRIARHQAVEELRALGDSALAEMAHDAGLDPDQLIRLVARGPHAADEMEQMMRELGLDPEAVEIARTLTFRDMQLVCSECKHKRTCHHDFEAHTTEEHFEDYCPNAQQLKVLRDELVNAKRVA